MRQSSKQCDFKHMQAELRGSLSPTVAPLGVGAVSNSLGSHCSPLWVRAKGGGLCKERTTQAYESAAGEQN